MTVNVVIDTNVFVSALMSANGASRRVLRLCFLGEVKPLMGNALLSEHEDLIGRTELFRKSAISAGERREFLDAYLSVCNWVPIYFLWRPNLRDEADNHLIELALAGGASAIVTANARDFANAELSFPELSIVSAGQFLTQGAN